MRLFFQSLVKDFPITACTKELLRCPFQGPFAAFLLSSEESCNATPVNHPLLPCPSPVALAIGHSLLFSLLPPQKNTFSNSVGILWESSFISSVPLLPYLSLPPYPLYFQEDLRSQDCRMTVANIIHAWYVSGTTKMSPSRPY